ncbi:hypothetical protein KBC55_03580 [Patescibacteria group bacterium]|nr:hypothetical protein [Patescibacteria group bacterium]
MIRTLIALFTLVLAFFAPTAALAGAGSTNNAQVLFIPTVQNEWVLSPPAGCDSNPLCLEVRNTTQWCLRPNLDGSGNPSAVMTLTEQSGIETRIAIGLWVSPTEFVSCIPSGRSAWTILSTPRVQLSGSTYGGAVPESSKTISVYNGIAVFALNSMAVTAAGPATVAGNKVGSCNSLAHIMKDSTLWSRRSEFNLGRCPTR